MSRRVARRRSMRRGRASRKITCQCAGIGGSAGIDTLAAVEINGTGAVLSRKLTVTASINFANGDKTRLCSGATSRKGEQGESGFALR